MRMGCNSKAMAVRSVRLRHQGQVLVWFLAFAATLAVVFVGVYSVGQVTSEKQKIVNATDAAAYSGGLVPARALNLMAYTNRAVIANEVLIAQLVSLQSWNHYFKTATDSYEKTFKTLAAVTTAIPPLSVTIKALGQVMNALNYVADGAEKALAGAVPAVITLWETTFSSWYTIIIQPALAPAVMAQASRNASEFVLKNSVATQDGRRDDPADLVKASAVMALNEVEWQRMVRLYAKGKGGTADGRRTAADLLLVSRDEFSKQRPGSNVPFVKLFFGSDSICAPFTFRLGSEKQGVTRLVDYDRWEAQDTVEFKLKVAPLACSWGKGTKAVPMGWGRSVADKQGETQGDMISTPGGAGWRAHDSTKKNGGWSGVKELYDVQRGNDGRPSRPEMSYLLVAAKGRAQLPTNETLGFAARPMESPLGSPDLQAGFAKEQMFALAEARIFFERPRRDSRDATGVPLFRADGHKEYASLYNPYWQVRLRQPSTGNKLLVYGALGLNPALTAFTQ